MSAPSFDCPYCKDSGEVRIIVGWDRGKPIFQAAQCSHPADWNREVALEMLGQPVDRNLFGEAA